MDYINFFANLIALLAIAWKTLYDLYLNPKKADKETKKLESEGKDILSASENKRKRADKVTLITFIFIGLSYLLLIIKEIL